jgi:tetratricopeptide (TPR) repeat protein
MDPQRDEVERLRGDVEWALRRAVDPSEVLPLLHRLVRLAAEGTEESVFAHRNLSELVVDRDPWRAALHARAVLRHRGDDDRGWALLGLCQTLLGNFRYAATAYREALSRAPANPWYAHNLGHLLDVALGRSRDALHWLETAYEGARDNADIAASYAHALAREGRLDEAKRVVVRAIKRGGSREHDALLRWLDAGAPAGQDQPVPRPSPMPRRLPPTAIGGVAAGEDKSPRTRRTKAKGVATDLDGALTRGMASLPFDARQRARAKELARDALVHFSATRSRAQTAESLAAAVAYAIVYVDHVPLTQAEVAGCFRVRVASLRGRFGELRAHLDLSPGDARYATVRG